MRSPTLLPIRMNAADTRASSAMAPCTLLTVVSRSSTTFAIDTFISDVSTTSTNIAIARSTARRCPPAPQSVFSAPFRAVRADGWRASPRAGSSASVTAVSVRVGGQPRLGRLELSGPEALGLPGHEERQHAQRGRQPVLVADHGDAVERRCVTRAELEVRLHGVVVDVARGQVEQPQLPSGGDLAAEDRFDGVLPVVVVDVPDRLEPEGPGRHVRDGAQHRDGLLSVDGDARNAGRDAS